MKHFWKFFETFLVLSTLVSGGILWFTREGFLPSMSAFALSDNVGWYYLMHGSMFSLFWVRGYRYLSNIDRTSTWKAMNCLLTCLFVTGIVIFDMYSHPKAHNISTLMTMVSAVFYLIYFEDREERKLQVVNASVASLVFLLGLWTNVHLFFAEVLAEFAIGVGMARRIWKK